MRERGGREGEGIWRYRLREGLSQMEIRDLELAFRRSDVRVRWMFPGPGCTRMRAANWCAAATHTRRMSIRIDSIPWLQFLFRISIRCMLGLADSSFLAYFIVCIGAELVRLRGGSRGPKRKRSWRCAAEGCHALPVLVAWRVSEGLGELDAESGCGWLRLGPQVATGKLETRNE